MRNTQSQGSPTTCWPGHRPPLEPPDGRLGELEGSPELDTPQTLQTAVLGPSGASTTGDPVGPACSLGLPGNRQRAGLTSSSWLYFHLTHLWTCSGCSCPQSGRQRERLEQATLEGALMSLGCSSNQGTELAPICYCTEPSFCPPLLPAWLKPKLGLGIPSPSAVLMEDPATEPTSLALQQQ